MDESCVNAIFKIGRSFNRRETLVILLGAVYICYSEIKRRTLESRIEELEDTVYQTDVKGV